VVDGAAALCGVVFDFLGGAEPSNNLGRDLGPTCRRVEVDGSGGGMGGGSRDRSKRKPCLRWW
jgi:hypothetical protein